MPGAASPSPGSAVRATSTSLRFALLLTATSGFLDAYALLSRGVFAAAQTGNIVLLVVAVSRGEWAQSLSHLWSVLAFIAGVALAIDLRRRLLARPAGGDGPPTRIHYPIRWILATQAVVLLGLGFVPASAPAVVVIAPLVLIAGMLFALFKEVEGRKYVPVTMTGNLARLIESLHGQAVARDPQAGAAARIDGSVLLLYAAGALAGAAVTRWLGSEAIWVGAGGMALLLLFFVLDDVSA